MKHWAHLFVGRETELDILRSAYGEAKKGTPRVVGIVAESGFGKTRLVQEFFNWLSTTQDGVGGSGYWPDRLLRKEDNLIVNPEIVECGRNGATMPFLWWALRQPDPGARNEVITGALWPAVDRLKPHLAAQVEAVKRARVSRETWKELAGGLQDLGLDVLGNAFSFGLLGLGKTIVERGRAIYVLHRQVAAGSRSMTPGDTQRHLEDELVATILADLNQLAKKPPVGFAPIPLVIVIDDAHWMPEDGGARAFVCTLLDRARAESWPLLLLMTSWDREWNETRLRGQIPGNLVDKGRGDRVIKLTSARDLGQVVCAAFPGLPPEQNKAIVDQADDNPRFLDEILLHLDANPKFFASKDKTAALTSKGLEEVRRQDFVDLVKKRFGEASELARRALGLASIHGVSFSPRIVKLTADQLALAEINQGLSEGEDPNGFIVLSDKRLEGEFRLVAYRKAAAEELGNLVDELEVHVALEAARAVVAADVSTASDRDLAVVIDGSGKLAAICAAAELIGRANSRNDPRTAGAIAAQFWPLLDSFIEYLPFRALLEIVDSYQNWFGVKREIVSLWTKIVGAVRKTVDETSDTRVRLAIAVARLGDVIEALEGPAAAKPYCIEVEALCRRLASEQDTRQARDDLASAVARLGCIVEALEGAAPARSYHVEAVVLSRSLELEQSTPESRRHLATALARLGDTVKVLEGPASAKPYYIEAEALFRVLASEQGTPVARRDLARTVTRLGDILEWLEGANAAKPFRVEDEVLSRALALEQGTPEAQRDLAIALCRLCDIVEALEGPAAAKQYCVEAETLFRKLQSEQDTPQARSDLANVVTQIANIDDALQERWPENGSFSY